MIIKDKIWGNIEIESKYESIVNSKELQKLKTKKQLGMSLCDKSIHTRFDHSIGVYYLACKLINVIKEKFSGYIIINEYEEDAIKIMALTHDIGHGPFSHLAERLLNGSHEDNTVLLLKEKTSIHNEIVNNFGTTVLDKVIYLVELKEKVKNGEKISDTPDIMFIISKLLSGGIDIDRLDYLARDSYYELGCKYDFSDILNHINLDYIDDYLEISFDKNNEYIIANYLNKRYEMYDTIYLNDTKFIIEACLDKLIKKLNYKVTWNSNEEDILDFFKTSYNSLPYVEKRLIDIVLNKRVDENIKYRVFNNIDEYNYFYNKITKNKHSKLNNFNDALILTSNKLNIYSDKNRIYIKDKEEVTDMRSCPILNSNLKREKYIIGIDFDIIKKYNSIFDYQNLENEFGPQIELEKKYLYDTANIEECKNHIINMLMLTNKKEVSNNDIYYDYNNKLKEKRITVRHRITDEKEIWNIKEPIIDKSSITKRSEKTFNNMNEVLNYLNMKYRLNLIILNKEYESVTKREDYLFNFKNSTFEIAFDNVCAENISFDMIECELKQGNSIDLYYLNNIMHLFMYLVDCPNSKSEIFEELKQNPKLKKKYISRIKM